MLIFNNSLFAIVFCWLSAMLPTFINAWFELYNKVVTPNSVSETHPSLADTVTTGARTGLKECQYQFRWERWNCPQKSLPFLVKNIQLRGSREMSFVNSIGAAGITYILTKKCSEGKLESCKCDRAKPRQARHVDHSWRWGGCSDNARYAERVAKQLLVSSRDSQADDRAAVDLHNSAAGAKAVRKTMRLVCKCHGVSGSCAVKTCWYRLGEFRRVGNFLKRRYKRAVKANLENGILKLARINRRSSVSSYDLVFTDESPNYCQYNVTMGIMGTAGRECLKTRKAESLAAFRKKSCKRLCTSCGQKVRKFYVREEKLCKCEFKWCCEIKCQKCAKELVRYVCAEK